MTGSGEPPANDIKLEDNAVKLAGGQALTGPPLDSPPAVDPERKTLTARDFTYDKTGLPRYSSGVREVVSAMIYDKGGSGPFGTSAAIVTQDDFNQVVGWYRSQMPTGWHDQTVGDFEGLAQKLRQMVPLGAQNDAAQQTTSATSATPDSNPTQAAPPARVQLSIFTPPSGAPGAPGIMIVKKGDESVVVMLKAHSTSPEN